jgi:hypothetical protein
MKKRVTGKISFLLLTFNIQKQNIMNISFAKKFLAGLMISAVMLSFSFPDHRPDYTGTWLLNEGKSDFGQRGGRFAAHTIKVEQKEESITITKTSPSFQGGDDVTTSETFTFDGKEVQGTGFGGAVRKSTLKWSDDGHNFSIHSSTTMERNGQTIEFTSAETWLLGEDGKTLTINTVSTTQRGEMTTKAVYNKK